MLIDEFDENADDIAYPRIETPLIDEEAASAEPKQPDD